MKRTQDCCRRNNSQLFDRLHLSVLPNTGLILDFWNCWENSCWLHKTQSLSGAEYSWTLTLWLLIPFWCTAASQHMILRFPRLTGQLLVCRKQLIWQVSKILNPWTWSMRINQLGESQAEWEERAGKSIWSVFETVNILMYIIMACNTHGTNLAVIFQGKFPLTSHALCL